jgi:hypothetical protein
LVTHVSSGSALAIASAGVVGMTSGTVRAANTAKAVTLRRRRWIGRDGNRR